MKIDSSRSSSYNPNFGYKVFTDIGCSKPLKGSIKISILPKGSYKSIFSSIDIKDKSLLEVSTKGFKNSGEFLECVVQRIKQYIELARPRLAPEDNELEKVAILAPCILKNNVTTCIGGLKKNTNPKEFLTDIDFNIVSKKLQKEFQTGKDYEFKVANDMSGVTAAVSRVLKKSPQFGLNFDDGFSGFVAMTGGGFGLTRLQLRNGIVQLSATQKGHTKLFKKGKMTASENGASVPGLLSNYINTLKKHGVKLNDENSQKIINLGQARVATEFPVSINKSDDFVKNQFNNSGLFKQVAVDNDNVYFELIGVDKNTHKMASQRAINKYIDSIAFVIANECGERMDGVALAGPLVKIIKDRVMSVSGKNLEKILTDRIYSKMGERVALAAASNKFKVVYVPDLYDNTAGADLILKSKIKDNWVDLPYEML